MPPSLSFILPVFNVERTLASQVHHLLDLLGELTTHFEIVVIDDGSTDHTCNVADELAREYPQIRVLRHGTRRGVFGWEETALARTHGKTLMMATPGIPVQIGDLRQLWQSRESIETPAIPQTLFGKLAQWGNAVTQETRERTALETRSVRLLKRNALAANTQRELRRPASFTAHLRELAGR